MADAPFDPYAVGPIQPLGLAGPASLPVADIVPTTEEQYFQDITAPAGLKPINPLARQQIDAQDPLAEFKLVPESFLDAGGAKKIDLNARAKIGGFEDPLAEFKIIPDPLAEFKEVSDFTVRSVDELNKDRKGFDPVTYFAQNPDVARNQKDFQKLLEVARRRYDEGLTAKGVAEAAFSKGSRKTLGEIVSTAPLELVEHGINVVVQPTANVILGTITGDLFNKQSRDALFDETRRIVKKGTAEGAAGAESATVGLVDLTRTGLRKLPEPTLSTFPSRFSPPGTVRPGPKPLTDQEVLRRLSDDASFRQNAEEILVGQGESAKNFGLDKETMAKQGVELDPEAIRLLSLVDPVTMIATGGAFKLVGTAGKVLGTAKTLAGAKYATEKLADIAKYSAGKTAQGVGKVIGGTGKLLKGSGTSAATIAGVASAVSGGGIPTSLIVGGAVKMAGKTARAVGPMLEHAGKSFAGGVGAPPISANFQALLDIAAAPVKAAKPIVGGVVRGVIAGAPFAIAADTDEQAGTLLAAGGGIGAVHGAGAGAFRVVKRAAARRYFDQNRPVLPDVPSPGYGRLPELDALNEAQMQKLSAQDASEVNNFREILRPHGGELYNVDQPMWRQKVAEEYLARTGGEITPEQLDRFQDHHALFDVSTADGKKIVYLNGDATGLKHDAGHIFDSLLSKETVDKLNAAIDEAFPKEKIEAFRKLYSDRVGFEITPEEAKAEFRAEQFAALFNNVPVTELNAPKSLLSKFIDTVAEGAEILGVDIGAGKTTPNLGAPVSVGIRKLFLNAAGEVTRRNVEGGGPAPSNVTPLPPTPPPVPPGTAPVTPPTNVVPLVPPPANVVPLVPPAPAGRSIRVTPEQVAAFKQKATPEVRALADARAKETGVEYARGEAKKNEGSPTSRIIEQISDSMESGAPVVGIEHLGITSASTPEAPLGRGGRRPEQSAGYAALEAAQLDVRQNAPPEIVSQHSKNFVPVRWDNQGGTPTLIAMSLDKVISNILRIAADKTVQDIIPYSVENGKLTPDGWREVVADAQAYSENQANGRKGDGGRLEVPEAGLSIPAENPAYTPQILTPERANFQNLVQGLAPPQTSRAQKGVMPGNVKGQLLAEANRRPVELPANIPAKQAGKQAFAEFPPRVVQEVNPLRNEMVRRGVNVRDLLEVTERIRAKDIVSATPRPEINYKAPVTDITRGGFLPAPTEFRHKNLQGRTVEEFSDSILKATPEQWKALTDNMTGGLTGGAWNLGLGLKDAADLGVLQAQKVRASALAKEAMISGDFDKAYMHVAQSQFFTEAYQAATNTGSAKAAFVSNKMGFSVAKPPFPAPEKTQGTATGAGDTTTVNVGETGAQFLPKERVLTTEEQIDLTFNLESRYGLTENGAAFVVQELMKKQGQTKLDQTVEARGSAYRYFHGAEGDARAKSILSVLEKEGTKPSDLRNLLSEEVPDRTVEQLKESGDPQLLSPAQIRDINRRLPSKLHGKLRRLRNFGDEGAILVLDYDQNNPSTTVKQAQKYLNPLGFDVVDDSIRGYARIEKVGPKGPNKFDFGQTRGPNPLLGDNEFGLDYGGFLPAEQLEVGTATPEPDLRIVRTPAAAGGTPPIEPPTGTVIPPPVAAGRFQPAEQLQPEETPELKVVPTASATPPIQPPGRGLIPPPVAAKEDKESAKFLPTPSTEIQDLAKKYAEDNGINYVPTTGYAEIKPDLSKRLAKFYNDAKSDPTNPEVAKSYSALIKETEEQGKAILAAGYKIEPWAGAGEPYKNSAEAIADVRDNRHLYFRKTSGAGDFNAGNPMLAESNLVPGQSANDVFRWVHDFFGHSKEGFQFGPRGEFNAWRAHSEMYSPEAQGALASETLAQNSWVNFGPQLEGRDIPLKDRPFAEQKNLVVPPELIAEAAKFQPRTEAGRKLEEKGFEIVETGEMGVRRVTILDKDKTAIAQIQSVQLSPKKAEISFVSKKKGAPAGLGEVLYREVGSRLRDDGVTSLGGHIIRPEPLAIRKKIFGGFKKLTVNDEPATYAEALATAERLNYTDTGTHEVAAIEPVNEITAKTKFLPGKRDAQGRPLDKEGNIDYAKWQKEGIAAVKKQRAEPIEKSVPKGKVSVDLGTATGWVLPNKEFVPLDAAFHEQYLANNAADLNKRFNTKFSETSSVEDRLDALNAGFVRLRNQGGSMRVEANSERWRDLKTTVLNTLTDREGKIDNLVVSLLNRKGKQVDSVSAPRLQELSGPEKIDAISEAVGSLRSGAFLPAEGGLPGIGVLTKEEQGRARASRRISTVKKDNPEAVTPQYARDESGEIIVTPDGTPKPLTLDYDFINSPLAKEAAKGLKGAKREEAAAVALGDELVKVYREVEKNPDIKAGSKWYSTARTRLKKVFGDDAKFFAELLGATSARTPVDINYRFALDAYNQFKAGVYDKTLAKYREGKKAWETQDLGDFKGETRGQFIDFWVKKYDLGVTQKSGAKFGMNSRAVLRVLDGSWAAEVKGPKTPNFAGNLTGETYESTIDVWAARLLQRLANEGKKDRWRILPENETGVTDSDFYLGQAAYRDAAKKLGIKPDALQAVLWFSEKEHWEKNGWTRGAGAAKSDFNVLLAETERAPSGELRMKAPQTEFGLDFSAKVSDLKKKR